MTLACRHPRASTVSGQSIWGPSLGFRSNSWPAGLGRQFILCPPIEAGATEIALIVIKTNEAIKAAVCFKMTSWVKKSASPERQARAKAARDGLAIRQIRPWASPSVQARPIGGLLRNGRVPRAPGLMSHKGHSRPKWPARVMSAFPPIATSERTCGDVRSVPQPEVTLVGKLAQAATARSIRWSTSPP